MTTTATTVALSGYDMALKRPQVRKTGRVQRLEETRPLGLLAGGHDRGD